jgi:hypothetical protein
VDWDGIPVMVLLGDDYQLPSIGNSGATNIPQLNKNVDTKGLHDVKQCQGGLQFMNLAEEVMALNQVCRHPEEYHGRKPLIHSRGIIQIQLQNTKHPMIFRGL